MADKTQVNMLVPDWRVKQIDKMARDNNLSRTDYIMMCCDFYRKAATGKTIIITSPTGPIEMTLKEIILNKPV